MPWMDESGRNRVRASALAARAVFLRKTRTGNQPPDGLKGSEVLPSRIHEGLYNAVAGEFQKSSKLTPCVCEEVILQIVHLILRLADPMVWEPIPFSIVLPYMGIAIDEWHARCLQEAADLSDSEQESTTAVKADEGAGIENERPVGEPTAPTILSFADLSVRFTSDFQIELSWPGHREMATYGDLGLADRRGKPRPSKAWQDLRRLADTSCLKPLPGPERQRLANRIIELRKAFKKRLNLNEDPFPFDKGEASYTTAFKSLTPPHDY